MRLHLTYHGWPACYQTVNLPDEDAEWYRRWWDASALHPEPEGGIAHVEGTLTPAAVVAREVAR